MDKLHIDRITEAGCSHKLVAVVNSFDRRNRQERKVRLDTDKIVEDLRAKNVSEEKIARIITKECDRPVKVQYQTKANTAAKETKKGMKSRRR